MASEDRLKDLDSLVRDISVRLANVEGAVRRLPHYAGIFAIVLGSITLAAAASGTYISSSFDRIDGRLDGIDGRLRIVEQALAKHEVLLSDIAGRIQAISTKLEVGAADLPGAPSLEDGAPLRRPNDS